MTTFNTTKQNIWKKWGAIINSTGNITGTSGLLTDHVSTYGTFVCNGATPVTVADPNFSAITKVITISLNTVGGTVGALPAIQTVTAGTGFTVAGTASDTSIYNYKID